jgi:hypothetical protein
MGAGAPHTRPPRRPRHPRARLDRLFTGDRHGLRERVLWRMLYETAARAEELLSLNIEDLDLEFRRARVTSKGGAIEYVHWATGTARHQVNHAQVERGRQACEHFEETIPAAPAVRNIDRSVEFLDLATACHAFVAAACPGQTDVRGEDAGQAIWNDRLAMPRA